MCTGDESRGIRNGEAVISMMIAIDDDDNEEEEEEDEDEEGEASRFIIFIQHHLTASLPSLSLSQVKEEVKSQAKIVIPIILTTLLLYSRSTISILFLGHQGKVQLAGGSLAIGFANITATSVFKGITMGMDPLCSQAFGAQRWPILTQTLLQTLSLLLLVCIPISLLWLHISPILLCLRQDPHVTHTAQLYLIFSIPELVAQAGLSPLRTFLKSQNLNFPVTLAASVAAVLHLPITYFLSVYLKLGVKGVALATGLNSVNIILGLLIYLVVSNKPVIKPWEGASFVTIFQNWKPLLSLALPSCVSVCLEWWWYEIMLFLCGLLSNPQTTVAAMGILIQTTGFLYVFPFSLSSALATRIGHSLGAGEASKAQRAAIVGILTAFTFGVSAFLFLISVRGFWGEMFTKETHIVGLVKTTLPILGLGEIGNWPQTASCGVLNGRGRPQVGARINLWAFYLIGLPVGIGASFVWGLGFVGLWYGMVAAQTACFCMMLHAILRTDWRDQSGNGKTEMELASGMIRTDDECVCDDQETGLLHSHL